MARSCACRFLVPLVLIAGVSAQGASEHDTFDEDEIVEHTVRAFGLLPGGANAVVLRDRIEGAVARIGRPNALVHGTEKSRRFTLLVPIGWGSGAGEVTMKGGVSRDVYWRPPHASVGVGFEKYSARVLVLASKLGDIDDLYRVYKQLGQVGAKLDDDWLTVDYYKHGGVSLAVIRLGDGIRMGGAIRHWVRYCASAQECRPKKREN